MSLAGLVSRSIRVADSFSSPYSLPYRYAFVFSFHINFVRTRLRTINSIKTRTYRMLHLQLEKRTRKFLVAYNAQELLLLNK